MSKELDKAIARFQNAALAILDNGLQTIDAINSGLGIIAAAERQARNELRAADFTNCKACQSGLVLFLNETPEACHETTQAVTQNLWENCQTCQAEYEAWLCSHAPNPDDDVLLDNPSDWEVQHGL